MKNEVEGQGGGGIGEAVADRDRCLIILSAMHIITSQSLPLELALWATV